MMDLKNVPKQKSFYMNAQLYTYTLSVNQFFIIAIFARQNDTKDGIILPDPDEPSLNILIRLIQSVNRDNI